jgi:hypothetical protein
MSDFYFTFFTFTYNPQQEFINSISNFADVIMRNPYKHRNEEIKQEFKEEIDQEMKNKCNYFKLENNKITIAENSAIFYNYVFQYLTFCDIIKIFNIPPELKNSLYIKRRTIDVKKINTS